MNTEELKDYILAITGELVDDFVNNFDYVITRALSVYNRYTPRVDSFTLLSMDSSYQFTSPYPKAVGASSAMQPMDRIQYSANISSQYSSSDGILEVDPPGAYRIHALYDWTLELLALGECPDFCDLVLAYYKQGVGGRRKAFNLNDLPYSNDGNERYQEGRDLEDKTIEILESNVPFWTAIV